MTDQRGARRARNSLSRDEIAAAAVELVEASGLAALTMRGVAERVGSSTMAVYTHVRDRDELLVAMLDRTLERLPVDTAAAHPLERLRERMIAVHDYLVEHSWVPVVLIRGDLVAPASFGLADRSIGDFIELGLTPRDALFAFGDCWHLVLGELLDRHPGDLGERPTQRERALRAIDVVRYPHYAHVLDNLDPMDGPPRDRFAEEIDRLLTGIVATAR